MARWAFYALPPLLYAGLIFGLSHQPSLPGPHIDHSDKVAHFVAYAGLGFLSARAFGAWIAGRRRAWVFGALAATAYGLLDEVHQHFVPGRSAEVLDLVADALGALAGAAAWYALGRREEPGP